MAYGTNAPFGLQPRSYLNGSTYTGQTSEYEIASGYATSLFNGDPITLLADGTIGIGVAGAAIIGTFTGCKYQAADGTFVYGKYWPANTVTLGSKNATALIIDDPNVVYSIQCASSAGGTVAPVGLVQGDLNVNADFAVAVTAYSSIVGPNGAYTPASNPGAGNTTTGLSGFYLDTVGIGGAATQNLKILHLEPTVNTNNVFYSAGPPVVGVFNNVLVTINNDILKGGTGTASV